MEDCTMLPKITGRALLAVALLAALVYGLRAGDEELIPKQYSKEQRARIQRFLKEHEKPTNYIPPNAKIVGAAPDGGAVPEDKPAKSVKQYLTQLTPHR